mgnify:CR=1 FL=1
MVVLDRVTAATTLSNTASETTMYTYSVPANMGAKTGEVLDLEMIMTLLNSSGADRTYTVRIKFGGTTHNTENLIPVPTSITARAFTIRVRIQNESGSNQYITTTVYLGPVGNDLGTVALMPANTLIAAGTIDQTAAQTLAVSLQSDAATSTQTITTQVSLLQLI